MAKKVSLKDIANKVGVSTALVSYVLNGLEKEKRVGQEVVTRIREAARDLNYQPNQIARSLRKGSTNTIGLIVADIANPFFAHLARIIEDEAIKYNYVVIIGSSDENASKSESLVETLLNRQVDGFIIVPAEGCNRQVESLLQKELPVILIDRYFPELATNFVILDNYQATYEATTYLIGRGCRKIEMIAYKSPLIHMQERMRGYREAMAAKGIDENDICIHEIDYHQVGAQMGKIMGELKRNKDTDAILFATNALSIAGLYAIRENKIRIPEELSVIGFDGNEAFDFFDPPLTFIQQPLEEMGKESVRVLLEQIKGTGKAAQVKLKHELIRRGSCR
ncbi:MAG: substrate-binding domain-containing protein [Prolixibacteraceae bacterium]